MYLLRLDDASEHWNKDNWLRIHDLLEKYHVRPIVAIIPHNEDAKLLEYPMDLHYISTIKKWVIEGWIPALHGYNHVCLSSSGGLNPVQETSEFAGVALQRQQEKRRKGYNILKKSGIQPEIFVAPKHTFDKNTLIALKEETDIRIISDTIARAVYFRDGFFFIPQQAGRVRKLPFPLVTFCYHPNVMTDRSFQELEQFLKGYNNQFTSFDMISFKRRRYDFVDIFLKDIYFIGRKIRKLVN